MLPQFLYKSYNQAPDMLGAGAYAFYGKNGPAAQLKSPVLENAVTLTIGTNAGLAKAPTMGRQRHGDMELLVSIDAEGMSHASNMQYLAA